MIVFEGKLSEKCREYYVRKDNNQSRLILMLCCAVFCLPAIAPAITEHWIFFLWAFGVPACVLAASYIPTSEKDKELMVPAKVTIDVEADEITAENTVFYITKKITEATVVYDMGEWYHIYFGCKYDRLGRFVCQKDLIKGSTVEEFEKLFENKIERADPTL